MARDSELYKMAIGGQLINMIPPGTQQRYFGGSWEQLVERARGLDLLDKHAGACPLITVIDGVVYHADIDAIDTFDALAQIKDYLRGQGKVLHITQAHLDTHRNMGVQK